MLGTSAIDLSNFPLLGTSPSDVPSTSTISCTELFKKCGYKVGPGAKSVDSSKSGILRNRPFSKSTAIRLDEDEQSTDIGSAMSSDADAPCSSRSGSCTDEEEVDVDRNRSRVMPRPKNQRFKLKNFSAKFKGTPLESISGTPAGMSEHPPMFFASPRSFYSLSECSGSSTSESEADLPSPKHSRKVALVATTPKKAKSQSIFKGLATSPKKGQSMFKGFATSPKKSTFKGLATSPKKGQLMSRGLATSPKKGQSMFKGFATAPKLPSPRRSRKTTQAVLATGPENLISCPPHVLPPSPTRRARTAIINKAKIEQAPLKVYMESKANAEVVNKMLDPSRPLKKKPILPEPVQCSQNLTPGMPVKKQVTSWLLEEPIRVFAAAPR